MIIDSPRAKANREGFKDVNYILNYRSDVFAIHYACESFVKRNSSCPRITVISIYNLQTGDAKSFSIHLEAQLKGYNCKRLFTNELDASERSLLKKFYKFVKAHQGSIWVHWNMRNSKYGFDAIRNRYNVLNKGTAPHINIKNCYDLKTLLRKLYGHNYEISSCTSKLYSLAQRNNVSTKGMLLGEEEAKSFSAKNYLAITESSQCKAEVISVLLKAAGKKELRVNASFKEIYGISVFSVALFLSNKLIKIKKAVTAISSFSKLLVILWKLASGS